MAKRQSSGSSPGVSAIVPSHTGGRRGCGVGTGDVGATREGAQGDGSMRDPRSCGILEADFLHPAPRPPGNDTKFVAAVFQNH